MSFKFEFLLRIFLKLKEIKETPYLCFKNPLDGIIFF